MISTALDVQQLVEPSSHLQTLVHAKNSETAALGCLGIAVKSPSLVTCTQMPAGVVAGNEIPAGVTVMLDSIDVTLGRDLLVKTRLPDDQGSTARGLKVYWRNGHLEPSAELKMGSWVQSVRSARDRHEQNAELAHGERGLYVRTIRQILRGQALLMWYEDGLARAMGVPILTLSHIRGHQSYVCTGCNIRFTHPNTLKAHMFLQCRQVALTSPSSTDSLIPFHQLLQTISKKPRGRDSCDKKIEMCSKPEVTTLTTSLSTSLKHTPKGNTTDDALSYRSAFRALPSTSREVKREQSSDESLMTPDSSTDQHSALNLSVKTNHNSLAAAREDPNNIRSWNIFAAQHMMAPSIAVPFEYSSLAGCYPIPSHFHPLEVQLLNSQTSMPSHAYHALLESRNNCSGEFQLDDLQECGALPSSKAHTSSMSPVRHLRNSNPYGFALPSDKEPLDLLPQAYFANKSKKGHLCLCCGKLYSRKYGLKIHMRTHNGYKPLKCKICSRPFGDPSNLNKHVRLHAQGETPYRCEFCGKVLVRRRDLERHVRSRHPMGCVEGDETLPMCESSPDSSPLTVTADSPEPRVTSPHTDISNHKL